MKIAYFDCFSGISGDMFIGALLDAGLEFKSLISELQKLNIGGFEVKDFWSAFLGALIISIVSWATSSFINEKGRVEYIDMKRTDDDRWEQ